MRNMKENTTRGSLYTKRDFLLIQLVQNPLIHLLYHSLYTDLSASSIFEWLNDSMLQPLLISVIFYNIQLNEVTFLGQ